MQLGSIQLVSPASEAPCKDFTCFPAWFLRWFPSHPLSTFIFGKRPFPLTLLMYFAFPLARGGVSINNGNEAPVTAFG